MLSLVVHLHGSTIRHPLATGTIVIGSGAPAQLTIADPAIAPVHAALSIGDDGIFLVDLGSATGTRVNGAAIRRAQLRENDEVVLGSTRLTIERPAPSVTAPKPVAAAEKSAGVKRTFLQPTRGGRAVEVAQLWGDSLVGLAHFRAGESVTLGESPRCAFFAPGEDHVLVTHRHGEPIVRIPRGATGSVERNGDRLPLAAWLARGASDDLADVAEIPLAPGERITYEASPGLTLLLVAASS